MRFPLGEVLDNEILAIQRALDEHSPPNVRSSPSAVFRETLGEATGDIRRTSRNTYAPADDDNNAKQQPTASDGLPPTG